MDEPPLFFSAMSELPEPLAAHLQTAGEELIARLSTIPQAALEHPLFLATAPRVWACSDFVLQQSQRHLPTLIDLFLSGDMEKTYPQGSYQTTLRAILEQQQQEPGLQKALRLFRNREMVRIAWRDICGWADLAETMADLSALADACILQTRDWLYRIYSTHFGRPVSHKGLVQQLLIIAVGKLGGYELNFSSDVDLIFAYSGAGKTQGALRSLDSETFFIRLTQAIIKNLSEVTEDGFVFRVDTRLRPYGGGGPLLMTLSAMEQYYQEQGREWERYALLKARVLGKKNKKAQQLEKMIQRFVYRRYIDYGVIDALRDLKNMMDREARLHSTQNNIKRGPGGIREIEFIVQAMQIIRGGKEVYLQNSRFFPALNLLAKYDCLSAEVIQALMQAYIFLRHTENKLQMIADRQTQNLPNSSLNQCRLTYAMKFSDWSSFTTELTKHRKRVRSHFSAMIKSPNEKRFSEQVDKKYIGDFSAIWLGTISDNDAINMLEKHGFNTDNLDILRLLQQFRESFRVRQLGSVAKKRLQSFMPLLLLELREQTTQPLIVLQRVLLLLESIVRRSAYLSLLLERPQSMRLLIQLCEKSDWIAKQLQQYPGLLDELFIVEDLRSFQDPVALQEQLFQRLLLIPEHDFEQQIEGLCQFKEASVFQVAVSDVAGEHALMEVSNCLSHIASVVLQHVLTLVWQQAVEKYGYPVGKRGVVTAPEFVIIAYGKLGGLELGYSSDLDLVYLHDSDVDGQTQGPQVINNGEFYLKLGQRFLHVLGMRMHSGSFYQLDLRLRPEGNSGLLVSSIDAFEFYQKNKAWTWEHQALVRARAVAGSEQLARRFAQIRRQILTLPRDPTSLRQDVVSMRERMNARSWQKEGYFDVKLGQGGVTDIEFMVQYAVLKWAKDFPSLVKYTDNIRLLENLQRLNLLDAAEVNALIAAFTDYREMIHQAALQDTAERFPLDACQAHRDAVRQVWDNLLRIK